MSSSASEIDLAAEVERLRARLAEAEETLRAIGTGEADALVVSGMEGDRIQILGAPGRVYRQFIESMGEGTATLSARGEILSCNAGLARTLEQPLELVLGSAMREHVAPEDRNILEDVIARAGQASRRQKIHLRTSTGLRVPMYLSATLLHKDAAEAATCILLTDLEEVISAEETLRESEQRYRELLDLAPVAIAVYSEGRIVFTNPAGVRLLGAESEAQVVGMSMTDVIRPDNWKQTQSRMNRMIAGEKGLYPVEEVFVTLNGAPIDVEVIAAPLTFKGKPSIQLIVTDITNRTRAEAEHERLIAAIEQATEMVILADAAGIVQYTNPAVETVSGFSRAEAVGQPVSALLKDAREVASHDQLRRILAAGKGWQGSFVNTRKDGKHYTEEGTISPVYDASGRIISYVAVLRDTTAQREMEDRLRQAQKMETVGQLAGGVAHDFNNMLQVISTYAEMSLALADAALPLHKYLLEIQRAAQRSAEMTGQLLAFARKQTVSPKILDLNDSVASARKMIQRMIGEEIDLAWIPGHDLWKIKMDPTQLDQVLANLAVNARDAIGGVGKLTIKTENVALDAVFCAAIPDTSPGDYLLLSVSDNGCGMDKDTLSHLFEPFFTTKAPGKGTGLGLATVYGIVKQNNGFINVQSKKGEGSTFKVYLPRAETGDVEGNAKFEAAAPRKGSETLLVVEDEKGIRELARESLQQLGYTVLVAGTPQEAIRMSEELVGPIHLIITDVVLPQMNGKQLAERLAIARPGLKCLYMSGYTADIIANRGVLDEGVSFIAKPFSLAVLASKVREVLDQR